MILALLMFLTFLFTSSAFPTFDAMATERHLFFFLIGADDFPFLLLVISSARLMSQSLKRVGQLHCWPVEPFGHSTGSLFERPFLRLHQKSEILLTEFSSLTTCSAVQQRLLLYRTPVIVACFF